MTKSGYKQKRHAKYSRNMRENDEIGCIIGNTDYLNEIANDPESWIGDIGASPHITMTSDQMVDLKESVDNSSGI